MSSDTNNAKNTVAFSLSKRKKPKQKVAAPLALDDFMDGADNNNMNLLQEQAPKRSTNSPLIIPLTEPTTTGPLASKLQQEDAAAAQALMDAAANPHLEQPHHRDGSTNFSATRTSSSSSLTITSTQNTFDHKTSRTTEIDAEQQLQRDLSSRADDVAVHSSVYTQVPIAEFGAALLRGMGWKGNGNGKDEEEEKKKNNVMLLPRPHRLGLGATPKLVLPSTTRSNSGNIKRPDQVQREKRLAQQQEEYEAKRQEQMLRDKQQTLQVDSIIRLISTNTRARMVQLMGVPGLNRVLVQLEGETTPTPVKKGDVILVTRDELEERPFVNAKKEQPPVRKKKENDNGDNWRDRKRIKREEQDESDRDRNRDNKRRRRDKDDNDRRRDERDRSSRDRKSDGHCEKKRRQSDESEKHWLISNIRVRVVTKKVSSRQYKQKGLVLDVTHAGAYATIQMGDGQILDRVPERYLETALPKVGGNAIVLTGKHRLQKGKLLERNSDTGKGVIQVFDDMSVVKLSLDDMAEWCGPLDDDME